MARLFEETSLGTMTLRNRLMRSATWEGMCAEDGRPTAKLIDYNTELAKGGVGLIISGYAFVRPEGKQVPGQMGIYTDDFEEEYKKLTAGVHAGGGKIAIQLVHVGGQTDSKTAGRIPLAPSPVKVDQYAETPEELTKEGIDDIISAFGEAAKRAKDWGFDAVQLHGAHGYLINQFLSGLTNRRSDEYGGRIESRILFLLEVYQKVREAVGARFPVFIKLNGDDNQEGGFSKEEALFVAKRLSDVGIDGIEVSSGTGGSGDKGPIREKINAPEKEAYNLELALEIKAVVNCPVMTVGGFRSYEVAEKAVSLAAMDFIAFSRPLIREQDLPNRWLGGDHAAAECLSCNKCLGAGIKEGGIYCVSKKNRTGSKALITG